MKKSSGKGTSKNRSGNKVERPTFSEMESAGNPVVDAMAIEELVSMKERVLQSEIVEPLLRKMQFRNVYDNSGHGELGKAHSALTTGIARSQFI